MKEFKKSDYDGKTIVDADGRNIVLRQPNIMDQYFLGKALGEDANNSHCYNLMVSILYVAAIDGLPLETPQKYPECIAALKRLGDEGVKAVISEVTKDNYETEKGLIDNVKKS